MLFENGFSQIDGYCLVDYYNPQENIPCLFEEYMCEQGYYVSDLEFYIDLSNFYSFCQTQTLSDYWKYENELLFKLIYEEEEDGEKEILFFPERQGYNNFPFVLGEDYFLNIKNNMAKIHFSDLKIKKIKELNLIQYGQDYFNDYGFNINIILKLKIKKEAD